jgi:hypothetical protein
VVFAQAVILIKSGGLFRSLAAMPLMVLTHLLYGLGFWRGLFTTLKPPSQGPPTPVVLERIPLSAAGGKNEIVARKAQDK